MVAYNRQFFKKLKGGSLTSANSYVPDLVAHIKPKSVLDLGCGIGTWLSVFKSCGVDDVYGMDGIYISPEQLIIDVNDFIPVDLSRKMPPIIKVDLAYSLEVAEHLDINRADAIVKYLTDCSDIVFFGAAIPLQGGTDHFNEQWQSYWVDKFSKCGYVPVTYFRDKNWTNSNIEFWYRQNALLYVKQGNNLINKLGGTNPNCLYDIVHPEFYVWKCSRYKLFDDIVAFVRRVYFWVRSTFV